MTDSGEVALLRILLLVQGAIATATAIEAIVFGAAFGAPFSVAVWLTPTVAVATLWLAAAVVRRSRRARKVALVFQGFWLTWAAIDLLLAMVLTRRSFELVPTLTRTVLPMAIIVLLEQREVRAWFGVTSRRERKRAEAGAAA